MAYHSLLSQIRRCVFCYTKNVKKSYSDTLKRYFNKNKDVVAAYVFGSYAQGRARAGSDVDLAVLFSRNKVPTWEHSIELKHALSSLLKKEVDLIILNSANPILKHQVYKYGKTIVIRDGAVANAFFVSSLMAYCDLKLTRAVIEKKILNGSGHG